jgi:hypothetical protein
MSTSPEQEAQEAQEAHVSGSRSRKHDNVNGEYKQDYQKRFSVLILYRI